MDNTETFMRHLSAKLQDATIQHLDQTPRQGRSNAEILGGVAIYAGGLIQSISKKCQVDQEEVLGTFLVYLFSDFNLDTDKLQRYVDQFLDDIIKSDDGKEAQP